MLYGTKPALLLPSQGGSASGSEGVLEPSGTGETFTLLNKERDHLAYCAIRVPTPGWYAIDELGRRNASE